jgi:hypothetical protein
MAGVVMAAGTVADCWLLKIAGENKTIKRPLLYNQPELSTHVEFDSNDK